MYTEQDLLDVLKGSEFSNKTHSRIRHLMSIIAKGLEAHHKGMKVVKPTYPLDFTIRHREATIGFVRSDMVYQADALFCPLIRWDSEQGSLIPGTVNLPPSHLLTVWRMLPEVVNSLSKIDSVKHELEFWMVMAKIA